VLPHLRALASVKGTERERERERKRESEEDGKRMRVSERIRKTNMCKY